MSQTASLALMRELQGLNALLFDQIIPEIEKEHASSQRLSVESMAGKGRELVNEAQIRQYILDPIFNCLGWKVGTLTRALVEAPAESPAAGAHRRFLDYHGREVSSDGEVTSLLVVEAKRLSIELPSAASDGAAAAADILSALRNMTGRRSSQLTVAWKKIFVTSADYVDRLSKSPVGAPKHLLLTNGNWFLIFKRPYKTLVDKVVESGDLVVFVSLEDASARSNELHEHLSYQALCDEIPSQHCTDLRKFLDGDDATLEVCLSADVSTGSLRDIQPVIGMSMAAYVHIPGAGWVQFRCDDNGQGDVLIDHRPDHIEENMAELTKRAVHLLGELGQQAKLRTISAAEFETNRTSAGIIPKWPHTVLLAGAGKNRFLLHLGDQRRPLLPVVDFDDCAYHSHGPCYEEGMAAREQPLLAQSTNPAAYFPSGSPFHCAHKTVHSLRENVCAIQALDEFLCCRRCALQERCWPKGFDDFPCKKEG